MSRKDPGEAFDRGENTLKGWARIIDRSGTSSRTGISSSSIDFLDFYDYRIVVCGDRDWKDEQWIWRFLDIRLEKYGVVKMLVAQGDARGADHCAKMWAEERQVDHMSFPAHWRLQRNAAGPIRNRHQLIIRPHLVVGFHDDIENSRGTKGMLKVAKEAGFKTKLRSHRRVT